MLAARFGGTPWQWRGSDRPDPRDWSTAVWLLEQERISAEEQQATIERTAGR